MKLKLPVIIVAMSLMACGERTPVPAEALAAVDEYFNIQPIGGGWIYNETYDSLGNINVEVFVPGPFPASSEQIAQIICPSKFNTEMWDAVGEISFYINFWTRDREFHRSAICTNPLIGLPPPRPPIGPSIPGV